MLKNKDKKSGLRGIKGRVKELLKDERSKVSRKSILTMSAMLGTAVFAALVATKPVVADHCGAGEGDGFSDGSQAGY